MCWFYMQAMFAFGQTISDDTPFFVLNQDRINTMISQKTRVCYDADESMTPIEVLNSCNFSVNTSEAVSLPFVKKPVWINIAIQNQTNQSNLILEVLNAQVDSISLYRISGDRAVLLGVQGDWIAPVKGQIIHNNPRFQLEFPKDSIYQFMFKVYSKENIVVPIRIGTDDSINNSNYRLNLFFGIYFGIMLVMFFYNFFLFITIKDNSYLYYVIYILFFGLAQAGLAGYLRILLWPTMPDFHQFSIVFFSGIAGFGAIGFTQNFLQLKEKLPLINKILNIYYLIYASAIISMLLGFPLASYWFLDFGGLTIGIFALGFSSYLALWKKDRSARFFLFAWIFFIAGIIVFVLRNFGFFTFNLLTDNSLQIGSALEAVLLSVALADRINILKREKEKSQAEALMISTENERIIREQNVILETKVEERTKELSHANLDLEYTLNNLRETQTQLVEAEKMASLGQLTAGVAHEINNPINFVSSNIKPLKRDVDDLLSIIAAYDQKAPADVVAEIDKMKEELEFDYLNEEITMLLKGMAEGANRTVEIVKSLRNFSRLDEQDLKKAFVHEGIDSTLVLLNSAMGGVIEITKYYDELPEIDCYPGKLNQVFMNILSNSLYALKGKYGNVSGGKITIHAKNFENHIEIEFMDNGPGIPEDVRNRIFDPFYTTKPVGEGTGLGLSIVYKIIESHKGHITVDSEPGEWTKFTIKLPKLTHDNIS
ncbi:MAG: sensor histidine kinase [Saprospiraceae bacterium]|nr:sensor histidine kinase [Saprospiraceae bacterium]